MADLLSILSGASTGLAAQRAVTATASHNIENANTPGYARQTANLETLTPAEQVNGAFIGRGVTLASVTQARDRFLEAQIPQAMGGAAFYSAESDALQAFHGLDVTDAGGLGSAISGFFTSLRALAQNAGDPGLRASFLGAGQAMARSFQTTAAGIESTRSALDAQASGLAGEITAEAQAVAQLNVQIGMAQGSGAAPNDLLDLRQKHLDKLAELAGARAIPTSNGGVDVALAGGISLVAGGSSAVLTTAPNASGHVDVRIAFPAGATPSTLSSSALGGSLGGTLQARDVDLTASLDSVNTLATQLADRLNAQHALGDTPLGAAGGPLFDASRGASAMSFLISDPSRLAMAGRGLGPGDATNANALLDLESEPLDPADPNSKDPQSTVSEIVADFGNAAESAKATADQDGAWKDNLTTLRESYSGVSIDEEMITLQKAQRGYEAIAKVLQTADQMLQTLMNLR